MNPLYYIYLKFDKVFSILIKKIIGLKVYIITLPTETLIMLVVKSDSSFDHNQGFNT